MKEQISISYYRQTMKDRNTLRMSLDRGRFKVLTQQRFCLFIATWKLHQSKRLGEVDKKTLFIVSGLPGLQILLPVIFFCGGT
ncbi:hypothetical protein C0J52_18990 [Blattella germanica]|nr:hypothetical protein C0J52_18990 [Blattella germanica]